MKKSEFYVFIGSLFVTVLAGYATMLVDASVGGWYLGESAVSAVNLLMPVNEVFFAVGLLLGAGANTVAAMAFGRGDIASVRKYFTAGFVSLCVAAHLLLPGMEWHGIALVALMHLAFLSRFVWSNFKKSSMFLGSKIEAKNSDLENNYGYGRAESYGLEAMTLQGAVTMFACNMRRIIRMMEEMQS